MKKLIVIMLVLAALIVMAFEERQECERRGGVLVRGIFSLVQCVEPR